MAERFTTLREALDTADRSGHTPADRDPLPAPWDTLLTRIRDEPGFAGFLRPPSIATPADRARRGGVVIVNVSRHV